MIILAFQLVHANSYLHKLVTWKNVQQASLDTLDKTIVIANKTLTDTTEYINSKIAEAKQIIDEKQVKSCDAIRIELAECNAAKQPAVVCPPTPTCPKCEPQKPCPKIVEPTPTPNLKPVTDDPKPDTDVSHKDLGGLLLNLEKFLKPVIDLLPPKQSKKLDDQKQSNDIDERTRDIAAQTVYLDNHLKKIVALGDCNQKLDCSDSFVSVCLKTTFTKDHLTKYEFLYNAISAESKKR